MLPDALPGSEEPRSACRREPVSPFPESRGHRSVSPYPEGHVELLTSGTASRGVILESLRSLGVRRPQRAACSWRDSVEPFVNRQDPSSSEELEVHPPLDRGPLRPRTPEA